MAATQKQYDAARKVADAKVRAYLQQVIANAGFAASMIQHAVQQHDSEIKAAIEDTAKSVADAVLAAA